MLRRPGFEVSLSFYSSASPNLCIGITAMFAFLATGDWREVIDESGLPVSDRVAIAIRFLSDSEVRPISLPSSSFPNPSPPPAPPVPTLARDRIHLLWRPILRPPLRPPTSLHPPPPILPEPHRRPPDHRPRLHVHLTCPLTVFSDPRAVDQRLFESARQIDAVHGESSHG